MLRPASPRFLPLAALALAFAAAFGVPARALSLAPPVLDDPLLAIAVDCSAAARRAASQTGGRVLAARPDGASSCEVTLLVPNEGSRPRRVVVSVPA